MVWFGTSGFVNAFGTGFFYSFSILFFHRLFSLPVPLVGAILTGAALAALPLVGPVGRLADRVGPKRVLIGASLLRAAAFLSLVAVRDIACMAVMSVCVALGNRAEQIATPMLAVELGGAEERSLWLGLTRVTFNAGVGLGVLVASIFIVSRPSGFALLGLANAASFAAAAVLLLPLPRTGARPPGPARRLAALARPDRVFVSFVRVNSVLWAVVLAVEAALPVYMISRLGARPWAVGLLFALNTALLTVLQLPLTRLTGTWPPHRVLAGGAVLCVPLMAAAGIAPALSAPLQVAALTAGMVVYTIGELVISATRLQFLTTLPPAGESGAYQAYNQLFAGLATALTPLAVSAFLGWSPVLLWWLLAAALAGAAVTAAAGTLARPQAAVPAP